MAKGRTRTRDDFPESVKRNLAKRVNYRCARCDAQTTGPQKGTSKAVNIGKAAHIKGAAPGGPRYDPNQTPAERASPVNGLWTCGNCGDIIDKNPNEYTVEKLYAMKETAERLADSRVGVIPVATLPAIPTRTSISRAIRQYCLAEEARFEAMDSRFAVSVDWKNGKPLYTFSANKNEVVNAQLVFRGARRAEHVARFRDFVEYGGSLSFDSEDVRMEGSPIFSDGGVALSTLRLSTNPSPMVLTVALGEGDHRLYTEFKGEGGVGQKGFRFKGTGLHTMAEFTLTVDISAGTQEFRLRFNFDAWSGKPLPKLAHYDQVKQFLARMTPGAGMSLHAVQDGIERSLGRSRIDDKEYLLDTREFFFRTDFLRALDEIFELELKMPSDTEDILREELNVDGLLAMMAAGKAGRQEVAGTLIATEQLKGIVENREPGPLELLEVVEFRVFGRDYGPLKLVMSCPEGLIVIDGPVKIVPEEPVPLVFKATDGYHWTPRRGD